MLSHLLLLQALENSLTIFEDLDIWRTHYFLFLLLARWVTHGIFITNDTAISFRLLIKVFNLRYSIHYYSLQN